MRVIFQTTPIPNVTVRKPDGSAAKGTVYFYVRLFEPGEIVPANHHPVPLAEWKKTNTASDGSLKMAAPSTFAAPAGFAIPAAVIPASVLNALPDQALIELNWHMTYGGAP